MQFRLSCTLFVALAIAASTTEARSRPSGGSRAPPSRRAPSSKSTNRSSAGSAGSSSKRPVATSRRSTREPAADDYDDADEEDEFDFGGLPGDADADVDVDVDADADDYDADEVNGNDGGYDFDEDAYDDEEEEDDRRSPRGKPSSSRGGRSGKPSGGGGSVSGGRSSAKRSGNGGSATRPSSSSSSSRGGRGPNSTSNRGVRSSNSRGATGRVVPYGNSRNSGRAPQPGAFTRGLSALRDSIPDPSSIKEATFNSISAARETTTKLSSNLYREIKGLTSSELEQVMLKATQPNDLPVKGKHVERLVGVTYQISGRYDIYDAVLRKLWSKMIEKDWRTNIKALYILHRFSADGAPDHQAALKARLRELRRTRDPKRKEKFFNSKLLLAGDTTVSIYMYMYLHLQSVVRRRRCMHEAKRNDVFHW